jgi:hypothetical protein
MPRTTIDIDGSVLSELKKRKERDHKSLGELVSELLAKALADSTTAEDLKPLNWTSKPLGLKIDLEDKDELWRILDSESFINE